MLNKTLDVTRTNDNSNTLYSPRYQQTYHSSFGAVAEAKHVFLDGAAVQQRLQALQPTRVLEIGFGLGLNCLLSADCANTHKTALHYTAIEHLPIKADALQQLDYGSWLQAPELAEQLMQLLNRGGEADLPESTEVAQNTGPTELADQRTGESVTTVHPTKWSSTLGAHTQLDLHIDDVSTSNLFKTLRDKPAFDAIYLDAFSPDVNPECWTEDLFQTLAPLLASNGRLATYCVKGSVRRALGAAGLKITKYTGPTGKREVLFATLEDAQPTQT